MLSDIFVDDRGISIKAGVKGFAITRNKLQIS